MSSIHYADQYAETETNCRGDGQKTGEQCCQSFSSSSSSSCHCTAYSRQRGWALGNSAAATANPPSETERPSGQLEKENLSSGSRKARADYKVKPPAAAIPTFLPLEIWRLIGLMMPHPQTLMSLVRVSRAFRNIFTPILHTRRIVNLEYFPDSEPLGERPLPPHLEHVQDFRVNVYEFNQTGTTYIPERNDEYAAWIARALESTRCLRSFSWRDESYVDDYKPALILHDPGLLRVLKGTETLKHICFQFSAIICHDVSPVQNCYIPLRGFRNLISLELYDFYRDHKILVKELAFLLCDSPFLKKLGLGFACDRTQDDDEAIIFGGLGGETDFLERLCEYYGLICETGPLLLETLRLGAGIYLSEGLKSANDHYLSKLLTARSLRVLHLENGLMNNDYEVDSFYTPIDWTPFPPEECKLLRQLSVSRLGEDVADWLRLEGNCVQELIVTDHYKLNDQDMKQFLRLPSSRLSMLWTREKYPWRSISYDDSDDDWTDTDSSTDEWSDVRDPTSDLTPESLGLQLCDVNASQLQAADPNSPKLDNRVMTVLDRLSDRGSHLERLCIALDFEEQWSHFSSHLKNLNRLAQLRINAKSWRGGEYPTLASSIWPDTTKDTPNAELALRFARLIGSMCPSLRYIMIGQELAWEVIWPSKEHLGIRTRSQSLVGLRKLDNDEILEIELFAMTDFPEQGGMLGQERDREEKRVGKIHSTRELNAILVAQGLSPLPV